MPHKTAIVIGAGIVGLAMAKSLAEKGFSVTVFERNQKAVGASIRNFGMIWPIGQSEQLYHRAMRSKEVWKEVCEEAKLWYNESGSLHSCYNELEWQVVNELAEAMQKERRVTVLNKKEAKTKSEAINPNNLYGALWSEDEMIIESRTAIEKLPLYLNEKYGVQFHFNTAITYVAYPNVFSGENRWDADLICVCSGADFETLYPDVFLNNHFTKCKLQMMRLAAQPDNWSIGPSLCGGLSLIHYKSFEAAPSLPKLKKQYEETMPDYVKWGIHVMVSQNAESELTIGDSHEYGLVHDPFDKQLINQLIVDYLKQFAQFKNWNLLQSWNGIYTKKTDGKTDFVYHPEEGVTIVNGMGGAGMTLSFGFAEEVVETIV
ncbi:MAG: TIGR03364 family FAD-dependent oxidoreductase [Bacteroidota bacterium]|nr:TIGR03364 family FAD-dependent oxidoreductase [Bacteroidota bacterium]